MASGYVTSDGKDLDVRYMAAGAKPANAGYADSAGHANTATTATKANSLADGAVKPNGNVVVLAGSSYKPAIAPISGLAIGRGSINNEINGQRIRDIGVFVGTEHYKKDSNSDTTHYSMYAAMVAKGASFNFTVHIIPMKV